MLAGLRVEGRNYTFRSSPGLRSLRDIHPFPSLHLERGLAKWLTADLSYSRRIAWPGIEALDPALRFSDPSTAASGNPALRPEMTDSFESKLKGVLEGQNFELTGFVRHTRRVRSEISELNQDGVLVATPVNVGNRTLSGVSLTVHGPLGGGLRYSLSANAADLSFDFDGTDGSDSGSEYGGSARLEYRDGADGRRGTDRLILNARYRGPTYGGFYRISSFFSADASWSHAFTDRLSGVLSVGDVFGAPLVRVTTFSGKTFTRQGSRAAGPRITFSLTYSLKAPPAR